MEAIYDDFEYEEEERSRPRVRAEEKTSVKYRIGLLGTLFLVGLAFVFDLGEAVLSIVLPAVGGYIKDFASYIVFPLLFLVFKIPFWKGNKKVQKMTTMITGYLVALIPIVSDILPELTISVLVTILYSRVEDRLGIQGQFLQKNPKIITAKRIRPKIRKG